MRGRLSIRFFSFLALVVAAVVPPQPVLADYPAIKTVATITDTTTDVQVRGLNGQSSCTIEIQGTADGQAIGYENGLQVSINAVQLPDSSTATPSPSISGPGTFTANCAGLQTFAFHPTSVTGSVTVTVIASGAVGRVIGMHGGGSSTTVTAGSNIVVATPSPGVFSVSTVDSPNFPGKVTALYGSTGGSTAAGYQVANGNGNWPNAFIIANAIGGGNATSLGPDSSQTIHTISGSCLALSDTISLSIINNLAAFDCAGNMGLAGGLFSASATITSLTPSQCVQTDSSSNLVSSGAACGGGGGGGTVTSVSGTGNISSTGGTTPVISITSSPNFTGITTIGTAGSYSGALLALGTGAGGVTYFGTTSVTVLGIPGNEFFCGGSAVSTLCTMDTSGNFAIAGAFYSSTGTIQSSRRAVKNNISDASDVAMGIIRKTKIVKFCYKAEHCKAGEVRHIGFIADDTDALLSTRKHNGEDIGGTAALALYGAQQADVRISALEDAVGSLAFISLGTFIILLLVLSGRK